MTTIEEVIEKEIDIGRFNRYCYDMKEEPVFGRIIADKLLDTKSLLRQVVLLIVIEAQEGKFKKKLEEQEFDKRGEVCNDS